MKIEHSEYLQPLLIMIYKLFFTNTFTVIIILKQDSKLVLYVYILSLKYSDRN